jgi:predicted transcriptional regulator YheO
MVKNSKPRVVSGQSPADFPLYYPIGEAIATLFYPYAEVVLHDLKTKRIVKIWNSYTNRVAGDLSKLNNAADQFPTNQAVFGPYEKALASQGRTKSITAGLRDTNGQLIGFFCINVDVSILDHTVKTIANFLQPHIARPEPIYHEDIAQRINYIIRDYTIEANKPVQYLESNERIELVKMIKEHGIFQTRNAARIVAESMKISRATVYSLLRKIDENAN